MTEPASMQPAAQRTLGAPPSTWSGRPVWAEIDLDALASNVRMLAERAAGAQVMAIVKANAYGHGAMVVAEAAVAAGASHLGVISPDEGTELRSAGIDAPILILGYTPVAQAAEVVRQRLTATVNSMELGLALAKVAADDGARLPVHVKVDTGLARFGSSPDECVALAEALRELPSLMVEGIFTHFASADDPDKSYTHQQFELFLATARRLPWIPLRHAAASAAILDLPEMALEMVRPGIAMYGYSPGEPWSNAALQPILSLRSRLARVHHLPAGAFVSYGRTWRAERPTLVGLVMAGYSSGLPRLLSNRGGALVRGRRVPIIGRVCMDHCVVDLTAVPGAVEGDAVTLIGRDGKEFIGADELGELCATISYEILTGISARVPRLFVRDSRVVRVQTLNDPAEGQDTSLRC